VLSRHVGNRQAEALVGDRVLGEAAVDVTAGEARALAEVLAPGAALRASPSVQPSQGTPTRTPPGSVTPTIW
jgi:hypothetical protein